MNFIEIAQRQGRHITAGDIIALPRDILVPEQDTSGEQPQWVWKPRSSRSLPNAHDWRWVIQAGARADVGQDLASSVPFGWRLLHITDDHPDPTAPRRSAVVAIRWLQPVDVQIPRQTPAAGAYTVVGTWRDAEPVTTAVTAGHHHVHTAEGTWARHVNADDPRDAETAAIENLWSNPDTGQSRHRDPVLAQTSPHHTRRDITTAIVLVSIAAVAASVLVAAVLIGIGAASVAAAGQPRWATTSTHATATPDPASTLGERRDRR